MEELCRGQLAGIHLAQGQDSGLALKHSLHPTPATGNPVSSPPLLLEPLPLSSPPPASISRNPEGFCKRKSHSPA